eukprot:TRINITY_DN3588_c0_g1_i1.p1 TRINITY_DN3588_c0_g1~~TRINITY_DN3588_c0_g1_i1.p1  ORF type:complete len:176 (+),score=23.55 TRINITY_DN3588_c0_g1_i1:121-648(+)
MAAASLLAAAKATKTAEMPVGPCAIMDPAVREPCGCTGGTWDDKGHCDKCKHGKRWHGDAWKVGCDRMPKDKPAAAAAEGPADINAVTKACLDGDLQMVKDMFPRLEDKDAKDAEGDTLLHKAVMGDHGDLVAFLMDAGCDPSVSNANGQNCVVLATEEAAMSAAQVLNEKGASG